MRGGFNREFTVIKQKHRAGQSAAKTVFDSGLQVLDSGSLSEELGFWITIISEIPDSLSWIPDSKR